MSKITMIYLSNTGNTEAMADIIKEAIEANGASLEVFEIAEADASEVINSDIIVMGCPACGTEELDDEYVVPFIEDLGDLSGKKVALFGSYGWGGGEYMQDWISQMEEAGATLIGQPVTCEEAPEDDDVIEALKAYGEEIAKA